MNDLVRRLSEGQHQLEVTTRPDRTVQALKQSLDRGLVLIRFPNTRGGTELGVPVDPDRTDLSRADFDNESGSLTLIGELTLDYVRVRCTAHIDLPSMQGHGYLEPLSQ